MQKSRWRQLFFFYTVVSINQVNYCRGGLVRRLMELIVSLGCEGA